MDNNIGIEVYCPECEDFVPAQWESIQPDAGNAFPWGDVVCTKCAMVLLTIRAHIPGSLVFTKDG